MRGLLLSFVVFLLIACSSENEPQDIFLGEIFEHHTSVPVPDTVGASQIVRGIVMANDSLLFFTELFSKSLFRLNIHTGKMRTISNYGRGPEELSGPTGLALRGDTLIVGDANPFVYYFDLNGTFIKQVQTPFSGNIFLHKGSIFKTLEPMASNYFKKLNLNISRTKARIEGESESLYHAERPLYNRRNNGGQALPGVFSNGDDLVFMNSYEAKVFFYNPEKREISKTLKLSGFDLPDYSKYHDKELSPDLLLRLEKENWRIDRFKRVKVNQKTHYFVQLSKDIPKEKRGNSKRSVEFRVMIFNERGEHVYNVTHKDGHTIFPYYSDEKYFLFRTISDDGYTFQVYKFR